MKFLTMGFTREILAARRLNEKTVFYTDSFRIDLAESFHFHFRNLRFAFSISEFRTVAFGILKTYFCWLLRGLAGYRPADHFIQFVTARFSVPTPQDIRLTRTAELTIELQQQADYIHLHYRNLRFELSIAEFAEFAEIIAAAKAQLDSTVIDYPRRLGYFHGSWPNGRVEGLSSSPPGTVPTSIPAFWTSDRSSAGSEAQTWRSMVWDKGSNRWKPQF